MFISRNVTDLQKTTLKEILKNKREKKSEYLQEKYFNVLKEMNEV